MLRTDSYASHAAGRSGDPAPDPTPEPLRQAVQAAAGRVDGRKTGEPEQSLLRVLRDHLRSRPDTAPGPPQMLDLRALGPDALALFTPAVARALEQAQGYEVAELVLPPHTRLLPSGIGALRALKKLELPGFTGTQLDLRGLPAGRGPAPRPALWICTPGAAGLREVLVDSTREATDALRFDLRTTHARKVALVDETDRRPVPGRAYFREALGREAGDQKARDEAFAVATTVRLNGKATFADRSNPIICRHLALANARRLTAHRQSSSAVVGDGQRPRQDFTSLATADALRATVPWRLDADFVEFATRRSRDNHLVAVDRWDAYLRTQAATLAPGQRRQYLVLSTTHVMHMEVQAKPRGAGDTDWVVSFYDPDRTATHKRAVVDRSGALPCTLATLLPLPRHLASYFGSTAHDLSALVIAVPDDMAEAGHFDTEDRQLDTTHAGEQCTPAEVLFRLAYGLHSGLALRLAQAMDATQDPFGLLMARDHQKRCTALGMALYTGQSAAAQVLVEAASAAAAERRISGAQLLEVLQGRLADGTPALRVGLHAGHDRAVQVLLATAQAAASKRLISGEQLLDILHGRRAGGAPALYLALHNGHTAAAQPLLAASLAAADEGLVSGAQLLDVLHSKHADGTPALHAALQNGHAPAAQAMLDAALAAAERGLITGAQLLDVLQSRQAGVTALHKVLYRGNATATKALLKAAVDAAGKGLISPEQLLQLKRIRQDLAAALTEQLRAPLGPAGLLDCIDAWIGATLGSPLRAREKAALLLEHSGPADGLLAHLANYPERAAAHKEALRGLIGALLPAAGGRMDAPPSISDASAVRHLNRAFMACNLHHWVDAIAQCLGASSLPQQARADILLALSPSSAKSALTLAFEQGHTLAVQAWMRAALTLALTPRAKQALLVGRDARGASSALNPVSWQRSPTLLAWAQCIARASASELSLSDKHRLLKEARMSHLLKPVHWHAPRAARPESKGPPPSR